MPIKTKGRFEIRMKQDLSMSEKEEKLCWQAGSNTVALSNLTKEKKSNSKKLKILDQSWHNT